MAFKVKWSNIAFRQFNQTLEYWNTNNGSTKYSQKLRLKIKVEEARLANFPFSGKNTSHKELRVVIVEGNYALYYSILNNSIVIVGFFDTRQDPTFINSSLKGS